MNNIMNTSWASIVSPPLRKVVDDFFWYTNFVYEIHGFRIRNPPLETKSRIRYFVSSQFWAPETNFVSDSVLRSGNSVYEIRISYTKSIEFVYEIQGRRNFRIRMEISYDEIWGGRNLDPGHFPTRDDFSLVNVSFLDEIQFVWFRLWGRIFALFHKVLRRNPVFALKFWSIWPRHFVYEFCPRRRFRIRNLWFRIRILAGDEPEGSKGDKSYWNCNFRLF